MAAWLKNWSPQLVLLLLALAMGWLSHHMRKEQEQAWKKLQGEQVHHFQTEQQRWARQERMMAVDRQEIRRWMPQMMEVLQELQVKMERVEQLQVSATVTTGEFSTLIRDSVVRRPRDALREERLDTLRIFSYRDPYLRVNGVAQGDTQQIQVMTQDTLLQVVHWGRRVRPWLWIFSPRELVQTVSWRNPRAKIYYNRVLRVEKRND